MISKRKVNAILREFMENLENQGLLNEILFIYTYGSTTLDMDYVPNINIGIIVKSIDYKLLMIYKKQIKKLFRKTHSMPLLLSKEEFFKISKLFPIEFLDMKLRHIKLYGNDYFNELILNFDNLMDFIERELNAKLLKLREIYFATNNAFIYKKMFFKSISSLVVLLKMIIYYDYLHNGEKFKNMSLNGSGEDFIINLNGEEIFNFVKLYYNVEISYLYSIFKYKYANEKVEISSNEYFKGIKEWESIINLLEQLK